MTLNNEVTRSGPPIREQRDIPLFLLSSSAGNETITTTKEMKSGVKRSIFNKIYTNIKLRGIKGTFVHGFELRGVKRTILHALRLDKRQEEIDTLYYLLNQVTDITKSGPTKDEALRIMQLCDVELLHIFDKLCSKHHLRYWLDGGTLLGGVRHRGFIPWDDDLDVGMPREDYDQVIPLMKEEMEKHGIEVKCEDGAGRMIEIGFGYKNDETGMWLDIFPFDFCDCELPAAEVEPQIRKGISTYRKYYISHEKKASIQEMQEKKLQCLQNVPAGNRRVWYGWPEWIYYEPIVVDHDTLFPLQKVCFEGYDFNAPANMDAYLTKEYGKDYMGYPRDGVLHHADPNGSLAKDRAQRHHVDMNRVLEYLKEVYSQI